MKKGMKFLILAAALSVAPALSGADLSGRFGIGVNWPGIQIRYGITDNIVAEGRVQFAANNLTVGGRAYYHLMEIPGTVPVIPYVGGGFDWVVSNVLRGGYLTGGFAGAELMLTDNISIGGDAGLYWADIWYDQHYADWGLIFNAGLTYYF